MPTGLNRALQVRTAQRLRTQLSRHQPADLPTIESLSEADQHELCDVGGGLLAVVIIRLSTSRPGIVEPLDSNGEAGGRLMRVVARLVDTCVRRTDLLGWLAADALLVLAPGLDPIDGHDLTGRLHDLLANRQVDAGGMQAELQVKVGAAYQSPLSAAAWTLPALVAEAERNGYAPAPIATVA